MELLVLDGKNYVKASKAAKELGYATDYVGQLCRTGQVDAHLIGRTWYVNQDELSTHKVEKKRMSRVKAREYAKKSIAESRTKKDDDTQNNYKNLAIRYEEDNESLLPETKKLSIKSETPKRSAQEFSSDGDQMEVLNKGEKVRMSGKLNVIDATDGPLDQDTTVLRPTIIKVIHEEETKKSHSKSNPIVQEEAEIIRPKITFVDRLEESNVHVENLVAEIPVEEENHLKAYEHVETQSVPAKSGTFSLTVCVLTLLTVAVLSVLTVGVTQHIEYTSFDKDTVSTETSYSFSIDTVKEIINRKI